MDMFSYLGGGIAELAGHLGLGFGVALSLKNLGLCFLGCLIGTLIGVLPGVGPIATITMLLPITFGIDPVGALIMLAGIYYGAQYGGSTTAILVNIPGEATSVVTTLDGHQMAKQGRAGVALGIAAIGSFFAGTVATVIIAALATPLTKMALLFGPADYFSLMVLGLMFAVVLARGSVARAIAVILIGILLSTVGTDLESGEERLTFGWSEVSDGLDVAVLAMGLFGFAEILKNLESKQTRDVVHAAIGNLLPNRKDFRQARAPILRGTFLGSLLGLLPGNGAVLGPFASYTLEKKLAKDPSRFGKGAIEGVAGPEAANNSGAQTAFIPLLTLGIPPNAVMALMVGAMTIHGIVPGPQIMTKQPQLFWGMIASMWLGNLMLLIINLPLIGLWVRFLKVPYRLMFPSIVVLCCIGIYSVNNAPIDVFMTAAFGLFGYALLKFGLEPAPLLLGFVLGRLMEEKLRQALVISRGHMTTFVDCQFWLGRCDRPISSALLVLALLIVIVAVLPSISKSREEVFQDAD
jgi:putative tricarboxylic transport membrane protein